MHNSDGNSNAITFAKNDNPSLVDKDVAVTTKNMVKEKQST